ncbi:MAG: 50S ribosome-binding GTPase [Planctomycetes bacterium]|nr:50S ribosome-binding GTPase [Planctomycetota bacterium]
MAGLPLVELGVHGGPAVVDAVFAALVWAGAQAGDWKELLGQAWRTGARDALFLAAHRWLGRAVSGTGARILVRALSGELQARIRAALEPAVNLEALGALEAASRRAAVWFRPLRVILTGPPNAGKSTLFNALLGWDRATVSPQAGTTRDAVEEDLLLGDRPVRLVDTAGDRGGAGGCGGPRRRQVQLFLADGTVPGLAAADLAGAGPPGGASVRAVNKLDCLSEAARAELPAGWLPISARTGEGLEALVAAVFAAADGASGPGEAGSGPVLFTRRDLRLLAQGLGEGAAARRARRELLGRARPGRVSHPGRV